MKKNLLILFACGFFTAAIFAQQPENPGFEEWEDAGTVKDEPVDWSSIKTSDAGDVINSAAPVVWDKSTDAHTGNYSLELVNVLTIGSIVATGTITNGRIHADFNPANGYSFTDPENDSWNTPLTVRPDSAAVWVKYFPQGTDTAQVKILLHTGDGTLPPTPENIGNWIGYAQINVYGNHEDWTYVKVPFTYFSSENPEYVLTILTAGAGLVPVNGSKVRYDDLEFIYNPSGIGDHPSSAAPVYTIDNTIYLDKLPVAYQKNAKLDLYDLSGSLINSISVNSGSIKLDNGIKPGLYLLRVSCAEGIHSQKIRLR